MQKKCCVWLIKSFFLAVCFRSELTAFHYNENSTRAQPITQHGEEY